LQSPSLKITANKKSKTKLITVIIEAKGTISKTPRKYKNNIPGEHENK
jgi:hypothetical protein